MRWKGQRTNPLNWLDADFSTASSAVKLGSYSSIQHTEEVKRMYYAIDVSKHQNKFDWQAAYSKGIRHAMLRAGYGRYSSQVDPQFERNAAECARLGIQYGVYWYSYASTPRRHARRPAVAWPRLRASTCACRWRMTLSMSRASCA